MCRSILHACFYSSCAGPRLQPTHHDSLLLRIIDHFSFWNGFVVEWQVFWLDKVRVEHAVVLT